MKYIALQIFILSSLFSNAQAATIFEIQSGVSVNANKVTGHSVNYYDQTFNGDISSPYISSSALKSAVTGSDLTKYAWTPDYHIPHGQPTSYIDLGFSENIYNGEGADLVLFFAGNATKLSTGIEKFLFSIDVGADDTIEGELLGVTTSTTSDIYDYKFFASYAMIDLDIYGFDRTTPLGDIRIYLGDSSMPALAGLGAYHTTAVPLPLSAVLFTSGLGLLSLFRRKAQS